VELRGEHLLGRIDIEHVGRREPEEAVRVGADRFGGGGAQARHAHLVLRDREESKALDAESASGSPASPPRGIAFVLRAHAREGNRAHVDLYEKRGRPRWRCDHRERIGDERHALTLSAAHEVYGVGERVARGLPSKELDRATRVEELEYDREVVLCELVVEHRGAACAADRHDLVARELGEQACSAERERVGGGAGRAREHADLAVMGEAVEDGLEALGRATKERS